MAGTDAQGELFETAPPGRRRAGGPPGGQPVIRPHFADAVDAPRLTGHNGRLLDRLRRGPVSNAELWDHPDLYGRNATHRISDVRLFLEANTAETVASKRLLDADPDSGAGRWLYWIEPSHKEASS